MEQTQAPFIRVSDAAERAGLSGPTFFRGCKTGAIPVEIVELGERSHYLRTAEFEAWLAGTTRKDAGSAVFHAGVALDPSELAVAK